MSSSRRRWQARSLLSLLTWRRRRAFRKRSWSSCAASSKRCPPPGSPNSHERRLLVHGGQPLAGRFCRTRGKRLLAGRPVYSGGLGDLPAVSPPAHRRPSRPLVAGLSQAAPGAALDGLAAAALAVHAAARRRSTPPPHRRDGALLPARSGL